MVNVALLTAQNVQYDIYSDSGPVYLPSVLTQLMYYVPLLTTNLVATALICYKAWCVIYIEAGEFASD